MSDLAFLHSARPARRSGRPSRQVKDGEVLARLGLVRDRVQMTSCGGREFRSIEQQAVKFYEARFRHQPAAPFCPQACGPNYRIRAHIAVKFGNPPRPRREASVGSSADVATLMPEPFT